MSRYKVSYGRCKKSTFLNKKRLNQLVPGRLYFIKDTGQIMRAHSGNTYESYSDQIHVVDNFPANTSDYIEGNIYIKKSTGRAKVRDGDIVYEVQCSGGGGGSGSSEDISQLASDVQQIQSQLTWKTLE